VPFNRVLEAGRVLTGLTMQRLFRGIRSISKFSAPVPKGALSVEPVRGAKPPPPPPASADAKCGPLPAPEDDLSDTVPLVDPKTGEWGGPTRGGTRPEPTRFGDWADGKGRCTDFS
jgi:hypothetical protein